MQTVLVWIVYNALGQLSAKEWKLYTIILSSKLYIATYVGISI